ncbi:MAG: CHAT domain-containing protein [Cytophagales bacterium]|nr:MAG: CHAT domain-containing protein [Cytophagales bacterium]TAF60159.1 MAG: CHAT domain-containing protein [Cytophagales bacterium]
MKINFYTSFLMFVLNSNTNAMKSTLWILLIILVPIQHIKAQNWQAVDSVAKHQMSKGLYHEAQKAYAKFTEDYLKSTKPLDSILAKAHYEHGMACLKLDSVSKAEKLFRESLSLREQQFSKQHILSVQSSLGLADAYWRQGLFKESELLYDQAISFFDKTYHKTHFLYVETYSRKAKLYFAKGEFEAAERLWLYAKQFWPLRTTEQQVAYGVICNNLAVLYGQLQKTEMAEAQYIEAKAAYKRATGTQSAQYVATLQNLARFYSGLGFYAKAEPVLNEALKCVESSSGKQNHLFIQVSLDLAAVYYELRFLDAAQSMAMQCKEALLSSYGSDNSTYVYVSSLLAMCYQKAGDLASAEKTAKEALDISEKKYGKNSYFYAYAANTLGIVYQYMKRYKEAGVLYEQAKAVGEKNPSVHTYYTSVCNNLAFCYDYQSRYDESEKLFKELLAMSLNKPKRAMYLGNLSLLYCKQNMYAKAEPLFKEITEIFTDLINSNIDNLTEKEKNQFFLKFNNDLERFASLALRSQRTAFISQLYNNLLLTKALIFSSSQRIKAQLLESQNSQGIKLYEEWLALRRQVAKYSQESNEALLAQNIDLDSLRKAANQLEKAFYLAINSAEGTQVKTQSYLTWQDVKSKLKKDEVAIEITRIRVINDAGDDFLDSVNYIALIVRPETTNSPEVVVLPNGNFMDKMGIEYYKNTIQYSLEDDESYNTFWKPLKAKIGKAKTVYISSDGVYHQINLLTLRNPKSKKYLKDEVNIVLLSSTRDLLKQKSKKVRQKQHVDYRIHLFGYPDYSTKGQSQENESSGERSLTDIKTALEIGQQRFFNMSMGKVSALPGTKKEIEDIFQLARTQNIQCLTYTGAEASEENFKKLDSPDILHIATHGFFISDVTRNEHEDQSYEEAFLRSGLLLAGAENFLLKQTSSTSENGILTAQEAMNINLYNTELLVLSACETGLGEIKNGEGVYGLQRAFQQAGAKTILMSLWKVDDKATQKLMNLFYENLLLKKQSKREAFQNAQNKLQVDYPSPYFWGAFVLVGE